VQQRPIQGSLHCASQKQERDASVEMTGYGCDWGERSRVARYPTLSLERVSGLKTLGAKGWATPGSVDLPASVDDSTSVETIGWVGWGYLTAALDSWAMAARVVWAALRPRRKSSSL